MTDKQAIRPIHPFPARMAPSLIWKYLPDSSRRPSKILDPMMGSGTTLVGARSKGHIAFGFDIDPLAKLIATVWCTNVELERVRCKACTVLERAKNRSEAVHPTEAYPAGADEQLHDFIDYWFDRTSRVQLWSLAASISRIRNEKERNLLWCAFSRLIITKKSGTSLAMDVSHSRPHKKYTTSPVQPFDKFLPSVEYILKRIPFNTESDLKPPPTIGSSDARKLDIKTKSVDLIMTSPPYLNALDYLRGHKLALVWMGYSLSQIRSLRSASIGAEISREPLSSDVRNAIAKSGKVKSLPPRHQGILAHYLNDMQKAIREMRRVIKPNGQVVLVIGDSSIRNVLIKTSEALVYLCKQTGFRLDKKRRRPLPEIHRYLPSPSYKTSGDKMQKRMKEEVVLELSPK